MQSHVPFLQVLLFPYGSKSRKVGEINKKILITNKRFYLLTEIFRRPTKIENFNRIPTKLLNFHRQPTSGPPPPPPPPPPPHSDPPKALSWERVGGALKLGTRQLTCLELPIPTGYV